MSGDRYIVRRFSPLETLGGGEILDPSPHRRRRKDGVADLEILLNGTLEQKIALKVNKAGISGISIHSLNAWINAEIPEIGAALEKMGTSGEIFRYEEILLHKNSFSLIEEKTQKLLSAFHKTNPLKPGMPKEEVRTNLRLDVKLFNFLLPRFRNIIVDKDLMRLKDFKISLSSNEEAFRTKIIDLIAQGGFQPPSKNEMEEILKISQKQLSDILSILVKEKVLIRITDSLYLAAGVYEELLSALSRFFSEKSELTVAEFRDLLNTSRKYALPYLEHLDSNRITLRTGDTRKFLLKK